MVYSKCDELVRSRERSRETIVIIQEKYVDGSRGRKKWLNWEVYFAGTGS